MVAEAGPEVYKTERLRAVLGRPQARSVRERTEKRNVLRNAYPPRDRVQVTVGE